MPTKKANLFTVAKFGDLKSFKEKFDKKLINEKSEFGSGLLHYAISGKQFEIALFLIENDINVNMTNVDNQTALHFLGVYQNISVTKALINKEIDINIKDSFGNNAMWTAVFNCKGRNYELVELLMKLKPDIVSKNKAGRSPIDFAKQVNNTKLLKILGQEN